MRQVILDTETTGLEVQGGHRIIEVGAVEVVDRKPSGQTFQRYINPEREIDDEAQAVHGISLSFLADKPRFADIADDFLQFIDKATLVIHNASFDMGFINAELEKIQRPVLPMDRAIDTLTMARRKFPGAQANLDALCRRFEINNSHRDLHGALIDADLLAGVYIELLGGRQPGLSLATEVNSQSQTSSKNADAQTGTLTIDSPPAPTRPIRPHAPNAEEQAAHEAFIAKLDDPIWLKS